MTPKPDNRPRFGWCDDLDNEPNIVREKKRGRLLSSFSMRAASVNQDRHVAVIPLPFSSAKMRAKVRALAKTLWPK